MLPESFAIIFVGAILFVAFMRSKHFGYALGTLPVTIIPAAYLIIRGILYFSNGRIFGFRSGMVVAFCMVLGLAVCCFFIFRFGHRISSKRNRGLYYCTMLTYVILLSWAYIYNSVSPLLM